MGFQISGSNLGKRGGGQIKGGGVRKKRIPHRRGEDALGVCPDTKHKSGEQR